MRRRLPVIAAPAGYELGAPLGSGGYASVYAGARLADGRAVAVKIAHAATAVSARRFAAEAEALRRAGAPALIEHGALPDGRAFLAMERVPGETLAARLARAGRMEAGAAVVMIDAVLRALEALHARGLVHRDLKPSNLMVEGDAVRLIDFGLALGTGAAGSPAYSAPEQLAGDPVDARADVYSVGAVLYELVTGRPPEHDPWTAPPRAGAVVELAPALDALIARCMAVRADERPASASALHAELARAAGDRAGARGPALPSISGTNLAALAVVRGELDAATVAAAVAETSGSIARARGDELVCAWLDVDLGESPVSRARRAAATLAARGAAVALHVAPVVSRGGRVFGPAVDRPAAWLPQAPWSGVWESPAAHASADPGTDAGDRGDRGARHVPGTCLAPELPLGLREVAVIGREVELAAVVEAAGTPGSITVLGGPGVGKSRFARAVAECVAERGVRVIELRGDAAVPAALPAGAVVVVDDAHRAGAELLDALARAPVATVAVADPSFEVARRAWAHDAAVRVELRPLALADGARLAGELLRPARRVPQAVRERIAQRAGGHPGLIVALVRALRAQGAVRRYPGSELWYVAADAVDAVPAAAAPWIAARAVQDAPPELAELARVCAALGPALDRRELRAVCEALAVARAAPVADVDAGVAELTRRGLLTAGGTAFAAAAVRDALCELIEPEARRAVHALAFDHWRGRREVAAARRLERLADHGEAAGHARAAARCLRALAAAAARGCDYATAERLCSRALRCEPGHAPTLCARGRARRMQAHYEDARADLEAALAAAVAPALVADCLTELAAIADFTGELARARELIARAAAVDLEPRAAAVDARRRTWLGVARARAGDLDGAIALLRRAATDAGALGDRETRAGGLLMLGGLLLMRRRLDAGARVLDRAIAECERAGDHFHLAVGLCNRIEVWRMRGDAARAVDDCQRAIVAARAGGFDEIEVWGWCGLAELHTWRGDLAAAVDAARRAHDLGARRFGRPLAVAALRLALAHAMSGDAVEASALLAGLDDADVAANDWLRQVRGGVALAAHGGAWAAWWADVERIADARDAMCFAWLRGTCAARAGDRSAARDAYATAARLAAAERAPAAVAIAAAQALLDREAVQAA